MEDSKQFPNPSATEQASAPIHADTAILLLAAGASTRMGTPKQLLPFEGCTLLRRAALTALATACRPVVVVLGANAAQLRPELHGLEVVIVENPDWQTGMAGSLRTGIETLMEEKGESSAKDTFSFFLSPFSCIVTLCDQPFVTPELLDTLADTWRRSGRPIVACEYGGEAGVPTLFDSSLFGELATLEGAAGAKQVLARHSADMIRIPFAAGAWDVDTPQEYAALMQQPDVHPAQ